MVDPEKDIDYEKGKVIYSTTLNKLVEFLKQFPVLTCLKIRVSS